MKSTGPPIVDVTDVIRHDRMTLRDWFAGQAIAQAIAVQITGAGHWDLQTAASLAYEIADALLAERDKDFVK